MQTALRLLLGMLGALLAAELVLQALPVSTATKSGYHHDPDLLTYPSHHEWTTSTGWDLRNAQRLRSNAWGFVATREFVPDSRAVALIGDSYVEASMLATESRPAAQLERALSAERPVYSMGSPGTALVDHAQRIRVAAQAFGIRDFVLLLEPADARQSLCGSGNVHSRCLHRATLERRVERFSEPGLLKRILRHSALAQYFAGQLKLRPTELVSAMFTRVTPETAKLSASSGPVAPSAADTEQAHRRVDAVVAAFFEDASPYLQGKLVVVVDAQRAGPVASIPSLLEVERARMIEQLAARGALVVDMQPIFARQMAASQRSLQVGPYDGHMNALSVQLATHAAAQRLMP